MATRPTKLIYQGKPAPATIAYFHGVPARDLDERDIRKLSDARLAEITGGKHPLYVEPKAVKVESAAVDALAEKKAAALKP